jgi:glycosyltransferase involved in cell wall biosynthesis
MIDDPEDTTTWADILQRILTDSDLRQDVIARGYAQAKTFSWQETARQTLQLYQTP